jgi:hypothetical protein
MKKIFSFILVLTLSLTACQKQQKQEYAGVEGDTVNGTPLPPVTTLQNNNFNRFTLPLTASRYPRQRPENCARLPDL